MKVETGVRVNGHDAAVKNAAELSGLVDPMVVSAKAFSRKDITLASVHALPFDPKEYANDGEKGLHFEFFYDPSAKRMAVRLVTTLGDGDPSCAVDGVMASRLALMAIELLEGRAELSKDSPAAREGRVPPMKFGLRQQMNFALAVMPGTLFRIVFAWMSMLVDRVLSIKPPADLTVVHDAKSLFRYYESSPAADIAEFMVFRPTIDPQDTEKPFRKFLRAVEAWRCASSLSGYFYLINFAPLVAPGVTTDINDIGDINKRFRGAFARPGSPLAPPDWVIANPLHSRLIFVNKQDPTP